MSYFIENMGEAFIVLGLVLLAVEILVLGFSTFVLFFVGIGFVITGALLSFAVIPSELLTALLVSAVVTSIVAIVFWRPLKRSQNKVEDDNVTNDMIGHRFYLFEPLTVGKTVTYRYSGIDWQVMARDDIAAGSEVEIVDVAVGILTVKLVS